MKARVAAIRGSSCSFFLAAVVAAASAVTMTICMQLPHDARRRGFPFYWVNQRKLKTNIMKLHALADSNLRISTTSCSQRLKQRLHRYKNIHCVYMSDSREGCRKKVTGEQYQEKKFGVRRRITRNTKQLLSYSTFTALLLPLWPWLLLWRLPVTLPRHLHYKWHIDNWKKLWCAEKAVPYYQSFCAKPP